MTIKPCSIRECSFIVTELAHQTARRHLWSKAERKIAVEDAERIIELVKFAASLDGDESYLKNYEQDD
jgi:hypothetical protein